MNNRKGISRKGQQEAVPISEIEKDPAVKRARVPVAKRQLKSYVPKFQEERNGISLTGSRQRQDKAWIYLRHVGDRNGKPQYVGMLTTNKNQKFQIISDFHGYLPKQGGWYICSVPKPDQPFLFIDEGSRAMVFTAEVFPVKMTKRETNGVEIVIVETTVSMSYDLLEKLRKRNRIVIFFNEKEKCFQIFSEKNKGTILENLSEREREVMGTKNPWKSVRGGILISPIYSSLKIEEIADIVARGNSDRILSDALSALNSGTTEKILITV